MENDFDPKIIVYAITEHDVQPKWNLLEEFLG